MAEALARRRDRWAVDPALVDATLQGMHPKGPRRRALDAMRYDVAEDVRRVPGAEDAAVDAFVAVATWCALSTLHNHMDRPRPKSAEDPEGEQQKVGRPPLPLSTTGIRKTAAKAPAHLAVVRLLEAWAALFRGVRPGLFDRVAVKVLAHADPPILVTARQVEHWRDKWESGLTVPPPP